MLAGTVNPFDSMERHSGNVKNVGITRQDDVRRSTWCRVLALDTCRGVPKRGSIPMPGSQNCVCPMMTSKKSATASLASGNVREHAAVPVGGCRQRENAVPRHWHAQVLQVDYRAFVVHVVLCGVYSIKALTHTSTWVRTNVTPLVPNVSCVRIICFTNVDVARASPSSFPNAQCQTGNSNFWTTSFFLPTSFQKKSLTTRRRQRRYFFWVCLRFHLFVCFMHFVA